MPADQASPDASAEAANLAEWTRLRQRVGRRSLHELLLVQRHQRWVRSDRAAWFRHGWGWCFICVRCNSSVSPRRARRSVSRRGACTRRELPPTSVLQPDRGLRRSVANDSGCRWWSWRYGHCSA